jgi:2-polyprenyl-3-methyl-5-hydroxy-6-metoxy-1,4-benzoquinol methylase
LSISNNYREYYNKFGTLYYEGRISGRFIINESIEAPVIRKILSSFNTKHKNALDIGCGFGYYSKLLAMECEAVDSIDISDNMIKLAKDYCKDFTNIAFHNCSFGDFNYLERKYDIVLGSFMLSYFENLDELLRKVSGLISQNSIVIFSMLHPLVQCKVGKTETGYLIEDYYGEGFFNTDFLDKENPIKLKKWHIGEILTACKLNKLYVEDFFEPVLSAEVMSHENIPLFYRKCPTVSIFCIRPII